MRPPSCHYSRSSQATPHSKASKSFPREVRTALHAGLGTAGSPKRIGREIGYVEKQGGPEAVEYGTKVKGNDYMWRHARLSRTGT